MIKGTKICGVSSTETLNFIKKHPYPSEFIGFITNYKKSHRNVSFDNLKKLTNLNNDKINFVSVLVSPDNEILEKIKDLNIDYFQLYNVDPERTEQIKDKYKKKIISALTIEDQADVEKYKLYRDISDIILFDGKGYEKSISFDHKLLDKIPNDITKMIAGNIKIDNIPVLRNIDYFIDISGGLENENGKKDLKKIDFFLKKIKAYEA